MKYNRILLKLSGEALMGSKNSNIDPAVLEQYSEEIKTVKEQGVEVAIVIGGGNIFRGGQAEALGIDRVQGDYMGMLATVMNALAMQSALEQLGVPTRVQSAIEMDKVCEPVIRRRAERHLEKGYSPSRKRSYCNFWCRYWKSLLHYRLDSQPSCY